MKARQIGTQLLLGIAIMWPSVLPSSAGAQVSIHVGIPLPPPIVFAAPPQVIVLPGSDIYVAPDIADEVYFVDGFWWRPWQGRWYRSHAYDSGWSAYSSVPSFYGDVRMGWRDDYRQRRWEGRAWNYERIPHQRAEREWSTWKQTKYWGSSKNWGVAGWKSGSRPNDARSQAIAPQRNSPSPKGQGQPRAAKASQGHKQRADKGKEMQDRGRGDKGKGKGKGGGHHGEGKGSKK